MAWFWFLLMLLLLMLGNSTEASSGIGSILQRFSYSHGPTESDANPLILIGPMMFVLLLVKAWMIYIGRHVESGELSSESASKMWDSGHRWGTILGAALVVVLEPAAGITRGVLQFQKYSETLATFLSILPLVLFAVLIDSIAYQWEQYCSEEPHFAPQPTLEKPLLYLGRRAQSSWLLPLLPIMLSCLGVDVFKLIFSEAILEKWAIVFVPLLSALVAMIISSSLLAFCTESAVHTHAQGQRWLQLFQEVDAPVRDIRLWHTGNRINNAMLLGFFARFRYVILSDKLLNTLTSRELEMVLLHEAAHGKCRHGIKRFLVLGLGIGTLAVAWQGWRWSANALRDSTSLAQFVSMVVYWGGLVSLGLLGLAVFWWVRGFWHRTELEADRVACLLSVGLRRAEYYVGDAGECQNWSESRQHWKSAMELSAALYNLVGTEQRAARDTWTHPSVKSRVQKLSEFFAPAPW